MIATTKSATKDKIDKNILALIITQFLKNTKKNKFQKTAFIAGDFSLTHASR